MTSIEESKENKLLRLVISFIYDRGYSYIIKELRRLRSRSTAFRIRSRA
jgi:hypothetical protein